MVSDPIRPRGDPNYIITNCQICNSSDIVYQIECVTCNADIDMDAVTHHYIGITRTTLYNRFLGHLKGQQSKCSKSPLFRHDRECHESEKQQYVMYDIESEKRIVRLSCLQALEIKRKE